MRILVTGAAGFLGRYVVAEALRRGHFVRAMVRRPVTLHVPESARDDFEIMVADLRSRRSLGGCGDSVDAVIHAAATKSGDLDEQMAGTVVGTENLLESIAGDAVGRFVGISTFAVYDYLHHPTWQPVTEDSPLETRPGRRDPYTQTKLLQERLIARVCDDLRISWTILRPGVVYGPDHVWSSRLGIQLRPRLWLRTGAWARVPLSYVENTASAILQTVESPAASGEAINVLDDEMPRQRVIVRRLQIQSEPRPVVVPIPWTLIRLMARLAELVNGVIFGGRANLPEILIPARIHAMIRPLRYENLKLHALLDWRQPVPFDEAIERCAGSGDTGAMLEGTPL